MCLGTNKTKHDYSIGLWTLGKKFGRWRGLSHRLHACLQLYRAAMWQRFQNCYWYEVWHNSRLIHLSISYSASIWFFPRVTVLCHITEQGLEKELWKKISTSERQLQCPVMFYFHRIQQHISCWFQLFMVRLLVCRWFTEKVLILAKYGATWIIKVVSSITVNFC